VSEYPFAAPRRPRSSPRRRALKVALGAVGLAVAFGLGIALGKALEDHPRPGPTVTYVRTLQPLPQQPVG
jgi:hypothetical protein